MHIRQFVGITALIGALLTLPRATAAPEREVILEGRAVLPAQTFAPGPISGTLLGSTPINGIPVPFASQPVQGISAVLDAGDGSFLIMEDNGYGAKSNSADFLLRLYRVRPDFETARGGSGTVAVGAFIQLRDPDHRVPFAIVQDGTAERLLTGADFDIESVRQDRNGDMWFGDEFGPFLLHTDSTGRVLEAPIPLPGVQSPDNPTLGGNTPNLPSSRGFEGTAIAQNRKTLYPMLEGALTTDPDQRRRLIYEFDLTREQYTGVTYQYHMEAANNSIGDFTALDQYRFLVIERDGGQGVAALLKRIYQVDLRRVDAQGFLIKQELVDLLNIRDPNGISLPGRPGDIGLGDPFKMPFVTIESVLPLDDHRILVINDNNFPFSTGRNPTLPDDSEFIIIRLQPPGW
jgi:glycerophosphoryl diester phosphodiesterase